MTQTTSEHIRQNGASIRALRQREGHSVDDLAKLVGFSAPHLRNIENELKNASVEHLAAIARALDVPIAALRRAHGDDEAST